VGARIKPEASGDVAWSVTGLSSQTGSLAQFIRDGGEVVMDVKPNGPVVVSAYTGQSSALTEWRAVDKTTVVASVSNAGDISGRSGVFGPANVGTSALRAVGAASSTAPTSKVTGGTSQTGRLAEWASNSATLAWIDINGRHGATGQDLAASSDGIVQQVTGAAGQTSDLTRWRNSAGSVLSSVDSAGRFTTPKLTASDAIVGGNSIGRGVIAKASARVVSSASGQGVEWTFPSYQLTGLVIQAGRTYALHFDGNFGDLANQGAGVVARFRNAVTGSPVMLQRQITEPLLSAALGGSTVKFDSLLDHLTPGTYTLLFSLQSLGAGQVQQIGSVQNPGYLWIEDIGAA
jgi:hypothetical protein